MAQTSFQGISPKQSVLNYKDNSITIMRRELRKAWNTSYARGEVNGYKRQIGPFRAVTNSGDFLSRENYVCGGSEPSNGMKVGLGRRFGSILSKCDGTGIPASNTNVKYVPDSSDYIKYKRQSAYNRNYDDVSFGGYNNSAYVDLMRVRRR
jgi:hypothetical protein